MFQSGLSGGVPVVVAVVDVGAYHVGCYVSDSAKDVPQGTCLQALARAPEASLSEVFAQPRVLAKELISTPSLKQIERARDTHLRWEPHEHVHMIGLNVQFKDIHAVFTGNLLEEDLAVFAHDSKLEGVPRILGFCLKACLSGTHKVERILSYATIVANQSFHFSHFPCNIASAHTNQAMGECANYAAHSLIIKERRNREVTSKDAVQRYRNSSAA
jgi:hypothetical protein